MMIRASIFFMCLLIACSPPIRLPFRDYKGQNGMQHLTQILNDKGFKVRPAFGVFQTDTLLTHRLGIYDLSTSLTIIPMPTHIRMQIHTFRKYKLSGRMTELPYIERHVYADFIRPIEVRLKEKNIRYENLP